MTLWKRRVAIAASTAALLVGGMSGLTWAANGSAPGNALYGLDRALEHVGVGHGGAAERLQEIRDLVAAGNIPGGLTHASQYVTDGEDHAAEALEAAAARVARHGSEASAEVRAQVANLLTYLSENIGHVDGNQVASLARQIGGNEPPGPPSVSVPSVEPGTPPVSVPPHPHP